MDAPVLALAIHHGHTVRSEVRKLFAISDLDRFREEDPFTGFLTQITPHRLIVPRSRFEVDLNRPRERAVYLRQEDAWGLRVWAKEPPPSLLKKSLKAYDDFYGDLEKRITKTVKRAGCALILDLHSYNWRRQGPGLPGDEASPEVNLGTGTLDLERWGRVRDAFLKTMRRQSVQGHALDVRENIKFKGGHLASWVHQRFGGRACVLAIEFKKTFMNEWTGIPRWPHLEALRTALQKTLPSLISAMKK